MWLNDTPYDWLERKLKWLGRTMLLGAVHDVVLGLAGLLFPARVLEVMGALPPLERFYFYLWPLLYLVFACFGILAWLDVKRNILIVTGAIVARVLYAVFTFASVLFLAAPSSLAILGTISVALAVTHYVLLRLSDFAFWEVLFRAGNPPGMSSNARRR